MCLSDYDKHLEWLVAMAKTPGWKVYAWERAKAMARDESRLWSGIADDLVKRMKGEK